MTKLSKLVTVISLIIGLTLTGWGLANLSWPAVLPWSGKSSFKTYLIFLAGCSGLIYLISVRSKRNPLIAGGIIAVILAFVTNALWPLLVTIWLAIASILLGKQVHTLLRIHLKDDWLNNLLVGVCTFGTLVGLLAHFPVNYPAVYALGLALPLLCRWKDLPEYLRKLFLMWSSSAPSSRVQWLEIIISVLFLIHYVTAMMPELGHDALVTHLFVPVQLSARHQWGFDVNTYVWAVMPMLGDWIFSIGYLLGGEIASRFINVGFIVVIALLVRKLVLWGGGTSYGAKWASIIFLSTPLSYTVSSSLYIDSVLAALVVGATLAFFSQCVASDRSASWLSVTGFLVGFALATKSTAFMILPPLILIAVLQARFLTKLTSFLSWVKAASIITVVGLIPYLTAWWLTGNPVFPFYNGLFGSKYYPSVNFVNTRYDEGLTWDFLYQVTFNTGKYLEASAGASGFHWLALILFTIIFLLIKKHHKGLMMLLVGLVFIILLFQFTNYLRYALPALAILAAAIGLTIDNFLKYQGKKVAALLISVAALMVICNLLFLTSGTWLYRDFPLVSIWSKTLRRNYLQESLPIRNAVDLVNQINVNRSPVAVFGPPLTAGLESDALYLNWYNARFYDEINMANSSDAVQDVLLKRGVNYVMFDLTLQDQLSDKFNFLSTVTKKIADIGSIRVLQVSADASFSTELLKNTDFSTTEGWSLSEGSEFYQSKVNVIKSSINAPASQLVLVSPEKKYLNKVVARCYSKTTIGRVQVNWLDAKSHFIKTDIKTFNCTNDWSEYSLEAISPMTAKFAVVYVTSHTDVPVLFKNVSFRR